MLTAGTSPAVLLYKILKNFQNDSSNLLKIEYNVM